MREIGLGNKNWGEKVLNLEMEKRSSFDLLKQRMENGESQTAEDEISRERSVRIFAGEFIAPLRFFRVANHSNLVNHSC